MPSGARRLLLLSICTAAGVVGLVVPSAGQAAAHGVPYHGPYSISLLSQKYGAIMSGEQRHYSPANSELAIMLRPNNGRSDFEVEVEDPSGDERWPEFSFAAAPGQPFGPGVYTGATGSPGSAPGHPAFTLSNKHFICTSGRSIFEVKEFATNPDGTLRTAWIVFELRCGDGVPSTFGEVRLGDSVAAGDARSSPRVMRFPTTDAGVVDRSYPFTFTATGPSVLGPALTSGDGADQFAITDDGCAGRVLAAGATCQVQVAHRPTEPGTATAALSIPVPGQATAQSTLQAHAHGGVTRFTLRGNPHQHGDVDRFVEYTPANGRFYIDGDLDTPALWAVGHEYWGSGNYMRAMMVGPQFQTVRAGDYPGAREMGTETGAPVLDVAAEGEWGCTNSLGNYQVSRIRYAGDYDLVANFAGTFDYRCGDDGRKLSGSIQWRDGDETPPAPWEISTRDARAPERFKLLTPAHEEHMAGPHPVFTWEPAQDPGSGIDHYIFRINGRETNLPPDVTSYSPEIGERKHDHTHHEWSVGAVDVAGNVRWGRAFSSLRPGGVTTAYFKVAGPPDYFDAIAPVNGAWVPSSRPSLTWEESIGATTYEVWVDGVLNATVPAGQTSHVPDHDLSDGIHTWHVAAVDDAGGRFWQAMASYPESFVVDTVPPTPFQLKAPADGGVVAGTARPRFTWEESTDAASHSVEYDVVVDGTVIARDEHTESFTPSVPLPDGVHTWKVIASDRGGATRESETRTFTIDMESPEPFALDSPANGSLQVTSQPTFSWDEAVDARTGIDRYEIWIDGDKRTLSPPLSRSYTPSYGLSDGTHTWKVTAVDTAGARRDSETRTFLLDTKGPVTPKLIAPLRAAGSQRPEFRWQPTTDAATGLDHYEIRISGAQPVTASVDADQTTFTPDVDLEVGRHTWWLAAVDKLGNRSDAGATFTVDLTPPAPFELSTPAEGTLVGNLRPTFTWLASSDPESGLAGYDVVVDGAVVATTAQFGRILNMATDLGEGHHTWQVVAVDQGGLRTESASRGFTIATTPPGAFGLTSPADMALQVTARPTLAWGSAADGGGGISRYEVMIDGLKVGETTSAKTTFLTSNLTEGSHSWKVTAVDRAGKRTDSAERSFTVDTSPPQPFDLVNPAQGGLVGTTRPEFRWASIVDAGSGLDRVSLTLDGTVIAGELLPSTTSFVPEMDVLEGVHTWKVTAFDRAGLRRDTAQGAFTVDTALPEQFELQSPAQGAVVTDGRPSLSWAPSSDAGTGLAGYEVTLDGQPAGSTAPGETTFTPSADVPDGEHHWKVAAVDRAGTRRESAGRTFVVDTGPPAPFSLISPGNGVSVGERRPHLRWEPAVDLGVGLDHYAVWLDYAWVSPWQTQTQFVPTTDLADGEHIWAVYAVDRLGNFLPAEAAAFSVGIPLVPSGDPVPPSAPPPARASRPAGSKPAKVRRARARARCMKMRNPQRVRCLKRLRAAAK
jgi:hypothetical protein